MTDGITLVINDFTPAFLSNVYFLCHPNTKEEKEKALEKWLRKVNPVIQLKAFKDYWANEKLEIHLLVRERFLFSLNFIIYIVYLVMFSVLRRKANIISGFVSPFPGSFFLTRFPHAKKDKRLLHRIKARFLLLLRATRFLLCTLRGNNKRTIINYKLNVLDCSKISSLPFTGSFALELCKILQLLLFSMNIQCLH